MKRFLIYLSLSVPKASCLGEVMIILGVAFLDFLTDLLNVGRGILEISAPVGI